VRAIQRDARPGLMMEAVGSDDDDVFAIHEADGRRYEALAAPAEMPIEGLDRTGWIHRWTLETVERHLGREPGERVLDRTVVDVAYLATLPPEIGVGPGPAGVPFEIGETRPAPSAKPVAWDRDALVSAVVDAFSRSAVDPAGRLVAAVARPAAGLESDGWLAVVCRDGGSADYHVLPTAAANRVLNGELFCAALEARLGRGR